MNRQAKLFTNQFKLKLKEYAKVIAVRIDIVQY